MNNDELDNFYGGGGPDDIFGGVPNDDEVMGGNNNFLSFDKFLQTRENLLQGGVGKKKPKDTGSVEVVEGYDSFTIAQSSVGETGHRFISKSPYSAALKAATILFNIMAEMKSRTKSNYIEFIIQKTTRGSNRKLYAYTADNVKLATPFIIFNKDEDGNRIVMNHHGQVLRVDSNNNILNVNVGGVSGNTKAPRQPRAPRKPRASKKGKAADEEEMNGGGYAVYDSKTTLKHKWASNEITSFNYEPYVFRKILNKIKITVAVVPEELKPLKKKVVDKAKEAEKKAEKKAKEAEKKEAEKAKKAEKKEIEKAKKAVKKEKAAEKKAKEAEKAKKAAQKEKAAEKKAKAPKAAKKSKSPAKAKAPRKALATKPRAKKAKAAVDGGYCGNSACGMNVY